MTELPKRECVSEGTLALVPRLRIAKVGHSPVQPRAAAPGAGLFAPGGRLSWRPGGARSVTPQTGRRAAPEKRGKSTSAATRRVLTANSATLMHAGGSSWSGVEWGMRCRYLSATSGVLTILKLQATGAKITDRSTVRNSSYDQFVVFNTPSKNQF